MAAVLVLSAAAVYVGGPNHRRLQPMAPRDADLSF
jgi:hypothetical protein